MIVQLKEKLASYTPEKWNYDDSNDPNILIGSSKTTAFEWDDNGFYQIYQLPPKDTGDEKVTQYRISYTNCVEGHTYALAQNYGPNDWMMYQEVYLEGIRTKKFRVDAPLERELVDVNGEQWEYTRVMRPGQGHGENQYNVPPEQVVDYFQSTVQEYYDLLSAYISVGKAHGLNKIPRLNVFHKSRDNQGFYYTRNAQMWDKDIGSVVRQSLGMFEFLISKPTVIDNNLKASILEQATIKWNSLI